MQNNQTLFCTFVYTSSYLFSITLYTSSTFFLISTEVIIVRKNENFQRVKILKKEYTQLKEAERKVESAKIYKRIQAFKLMYKKWRYSAIADFLSVAKNTISEWVKIYQQDGIDALITLKYKGGQPKLNKRQLAEIKEEARKGNFNVAKDVQHYIKTKWDIKYNLSHVQLLSKKNFSYPLKKQN